jgi:hypothetical protein
VAPALLEDSIRLAVARTATRIGEAGDSLQSPFREAQMQAVFVEEMRESLQAISPELVAHTSQSLALPGWPGVGPVDVALLEPDGTNRACIELKWGAGTLYNCIWDLAKMGAAVSLPLTGSAYLLAGAPQSDWERADGAECFASGTRVLFDLFERYPKHWRFWLNDVKTHPRYLPKLVCTTEVATVPFHVRGEPWTMRCTEVSGAAGTTGWWEVGPVEEALGIRDEPALPTEPPDWVSVSDDPRVGPAEVQSAEDHRLFGHGDVEALWRLVHNPPRWWKFWWFPGDVEIIGKSFEETLGSEGATLLRTTRNINTSADLHTARGAVEAFARAHPGDATAISAARDCVFAEKRLRGETPD